MISNRCQYALQAMLELAKREGAGPVTIAEIAQKQQIPARFLEAILRQLKQMDYTESIRGKDGGYILARPASDIVIGEVIRLIEGPMFGSNCTTETPPVLESVWEEAREAISQVYDRITFADLVQREARLRQDSAPDYSI